MSEPAVPATLQRIQLVDFLRGAALAAMTVYHFAWDLEFFGWLPALTISRDGWVLFARMIASGFLFLVGVSLVLAHGNGMRWVVFWKRLAQVAIAAALISLVTYLAVPGGFIFFGILHAIALFSLVSLLFLPLHWACSVIVAGAVFWLGQNYQADIFNEPVLRWVGMASEVLRSNDYVPMFPWLSAVLLGLAAAKICTAAGAWKFLKSVRFPRPVEAPLTLIGRRSLLYYLLHQPVMIALIWTFTTLSPPDQSAEFLSRCNDSCEETRPEAFCKRYCGCANDGLKDAGLHHSFMQGRIDTQSNQSFKKIIRMCSRN